MTSSPRIVPHSYRSWSMDFAADRLCDGRTAARPGYRGRSRPGTPCVGSRFLDHFSAQARRPRCATASARPLAALRHDLRQFITYGPRLYPRDHDLHFLSTSIRGVSGVAWLDRNRSRAQTNSCAQQAVTFKEKGGESSCFLPNGCGVAVHARRAFVGRASYGSKRLSASANCLGRDLLRTIHRGRKSKQCGVNEPICSVGLEFSHPPPRNHGCEAWTNQRSSESARASDGALVPGALLRAQPIEQRVRRNRGVTPVSAAQWSRIHPSSDREADASP